jgi:hypothetical protein
LEGLVDLDLGRCAAAQSHSPRSSEEKFRESSPTRSEPASWRFRPGEALS